MAHAFRCDGCQRLINGCPSLKFTPPTTEPGYGGRPKPAYHEWAYFRPGYERDYCRACAALITDTLWTLPYAESQEVYDRKSAEIREGGEK